MSNPSVVLRSSWLDKATQAQDVYVSPWARKLFLIFAVYLVIPIYDVPLAGLSLSAPILFFIATELYLKPQPVLWRRYLGWMAIVYLFWVGLLVSLAGNAVQGSAIPFSSADAITLIRFAYWVLAFLITMIIVANGGFHRQLTMLLGIAVLTLTGLRLYEAVAWDKWGAWTSPRLLSQNSYGIQFSTFSPYALWLALSLKGSRRWVAGAGVLLMWLTIAGNGSRSSWFAGSVTSAVFLLLYALSQRRRQVWTLALFVSMFVILLSIMPTSAIEPISERFATLQKTEEDKSFAIRLLMNQKGERLFQQNPLFGAGAGRFTRASVPLDIPKILRYAPQSHFDVKSPHNSYIKLLGETGLVGTVPFAVLLMILAVGGLRATARLAQAGETWPIPIYAGFIGLSIHFWTLSGLTGTAPWFAYGLVAAVIEYARRKHTIAPEPRREGSELPRTSLPRALNQ